VHGGGKCPIAGAKKQQYGALVFNPLKIDQPAALRARGKIGAALARWAAPKHHGAVPVLGRIAIACVKNEQDIIEPFLRHHAPLMDLIFVLDNNSSDDTHRIIAQLVQELGNVVLVDKPPAYHGQAIFVSQAMRYVQSACFADQIFFLDADEFLAVQTRAELDAKTARPQQRALWPKRAITLGRMAWRTFLVDPASDETQQPDPILRMRWRRKTEVLRPSTSKIFARFGGGFDASLICEHGNHKLRSGLNRRLHEGLIADLHLIHLPVRSFQQLRSKAIAAWISNLARGVAIAAKQGVHRKAIAEMLAQRDLPMTARELAQLGMSYATRYPVGDLDSNAIPDAHGISPLRRYSDGRFGDAENLIQAAQNPQIMASQQLKLQNLPQGASLDAPPVQYLMQLFAPKTVGIYTGQGNEGYGDIAAFHGAGRAFEWAAAPPAPADMTLALDLPAPQDIGPETWAALATSTTETLVCAFPCADGGDAAVMDMALSHLAGLGWHPNLAQSLAFRSVSTLPHLRRTAVVLHPSRDPVAEAQAAARLREIAAFPHVAPQSPQGLITAAFDLPYPDVTEGYGIRLP
jgi:hypothetical protein